MENIKEHIHEDFVKLKVDKETYFEQFYKNNYNFVYRICFSILKDKENSEDTTQVVFEKLYKMPTENLATNYESSWLYTVAKNEAMQFIRKNKFHNSLDDANVEIEDKQNGIDEIEINEDYKKIVKKLNKKQEQIVSLKVVSDFTFKEIGQMLAMPTATVQWYYYSSIKSLKAAIGSMAMFVISIVLGLKLYKNVDITQKEEKYKKSNKSEIAENSDSAISENESYNQEKNHQEVLPNMATEDMEVYESTEQSYANIAQNSNWVPALCFSLAGIFLVCSIVFGIICVKRKRK